MSVGHIVGIYVGFTMMFSGIALLLRFFGAGPNFIRRVQMVLFYVLAAAPFIIKGVMMLRQLLQW